MKIKIIIFIISFVILLNFASSLVLDNESPDLCLNADNLSLNLQFHPEINSLFISVKNNYNESISNLTFKVNLIDKSSNYVINTITTNISRLNPTQVECTVISDIALPSSLKEGTFFISDLKFYNNNASIIFFNQPINQISFGWNRAIKINSWNRIISNSYFFNSQITDEIEFMQLQEKNISFHLPIINKGTPYIPIDSVILSLGDKEIYPPFKNYGDSNELLINLPSSIPLNQIVKLTVLYSTTSSHSLNFLYLYPFSSFFYKLKTPSIGIGTPYLTADNYVENITDIDHYSLTIHLPEGYEYKKVPAECYYMNVQGKYKIVCNDSGGISVFYSSNCDNSCNKNFTCIAPVAFGLTPKQIIEPNKIIWSTQIMNNQPTGLSFFIQDVMLYRVIFLIFLICSLGYIFFSYKLPKTKYDLILLYLSIYLLIRLSLKIPLAVTLFEFIAILTLFFAIFGKKIFKDKKDNSTMNKEKQSFKINLEKKKNSFLKKLWELKDKRLSGEIGLIISSVLFTNGLNKILPDYLTGWVSIGIGFLIALGAVSLLITSEKK